ncbi:hypothetical protein ACFQ0M_11385 [Kitasatospora aburaviensis]
MGRPPAPSRRSRRAAPPSRPRPAPRPPPAPGRPGRHLDQPAQHPAGRDLPLAPAGTAKSVAGAPTFKLQELCHSKLSPDTADLGTGRAAAQSLLGAGGPDQWQAQQTLLYEGDPRPSSGVAQSAHAVFSDLREEVKACAKSAPGATVKVTSPEDANYFAATVTVPQAGGNAVTLHEYLTAPDGTVNELAVWTTGKSGAQPKVPWAGPADADVAKAMDSALCTTLKDC